MVRSESTVLTAAQRNRETAAVTRSRDGIAASCLWVQMGNKIVRKVGMADFVWRVEGYVGQWHLLSFSPAFTASQSGAGDDLRASQ